jgi:hypothetical protein
MAAKAGLMTGFCFSYSLRACSGIPAYASISRFNKVPV